MNYRDYYLNYSLSKNPEDGHKSGRYGLAQDFPGSSISPEPIRCATCTENPVDEAVLSILFSVAKIAQISAVPGIQITDTFTSITEISDNSDNQNYLNAENKGKINLFICVRRP